MRRPTAPTAPPRLPPVTVLAGHANLAVATSTTTSGTTRRPSGRGHTVATGSGHGLPVATGTGHEGTVATVRR
jgi:hypothetical protein